MYPLTNQHTPRNLTVHILFTLDPSPPSIHNPPLLSKTQTPQTNTTMASSSMVPNLVLWLAVMLSVVLISPAQSLNCTSQKFSNNKMYENCTDLPSLSSYLHWTYNSSNASLSIAFVAPPANSTGWIAWALNPTGTGMAGAQSFIAFKQSNSSMTVQTYNISSYMSIVPSKLSFEVYDMSAESSDGVMRIFAHMALPGKNTTVNHIWQVGSEVNDGVPAKHAFLPANLAAKGTLDLISSHSTTNTTTNTTTNSTTTNDTSTNNNSGVMKKNVNLLNLGFFAVLGYFMISNF